jgi:hypothetical protein
MPDLKGRPMRFSNLIHKVFVGAALALVPAASFAGVFGSVTIAPPVLPVYTQPICPGDGYLWNPGYWAYGDEGYYWVPGVWVRPPQPGLLWTPVTGAGVVLCMSSTQDTGGRMSASTGA